MLAEFLSKLCEKIVKIAGDEFEKKKKLLEIFISSEIIGKIFEVSQYFLITFLIILKLKDSAVIHRGGDPQKPCEIMPNS